MEQSNISEPHPPHQGSGLGFWIAIGIAMGAGIGVVTGQIAVGIGTGIAFGTGLGILTGKRTKSK